RWLARVGTEGRVARHRAQRFGRVDLEARGLPQPPHHRPRGRGRPGSSLDPPELSPDGPAGRSLLLLPPGGSSRPSVAGHVHDRQGGPAPGAGPGGPSPSSGRGRRGPRGDGAPRAPAPHGPLLVLHRSRVVRGRSGRDPRSVRGPRLPRAALFVAVRGSGPSPAGSPAF